MAFFIVFPFRYWNIEMEHLNLFSFIKLIRYFDLEKYANAISISCDRMNAYEIEPDSNYIPDL